MEENNNKQTGIHTRGIWNTTFKFKSKIQTVRWFLFVHQVALQQTDIVQGCSCLLCVSLCICAGEKRESHGEAAPWGPPADPADAEVVLLAQLSAVG